MSDANSTKPHDRFARWLFSAPAAAAVYFRLALPPSLGSFVDVDSIEPLSPEGIDADLRESRGDLLFRVNTTSGPMMALLIFEHQSVADRLMGPRLLRYISQAWEREERREAGRRWPPVFASVLYNGLEPWTAPRSLAELVGDDECAQGFRAFTPQLEFSVVELRSLPDEQLHALADLRNSAAVALGLLGLKWGRSPALLKHFADWIQRFSDPQEEELATWSALVLYLVRCNSISARRYLDLIEANPSQGLEDMIKTTAEQLIDEGIEIGRTESHTEARAEGHAEGKAEGRSEALHDVMIRMLNAANASTPQRLLSIKHATPEQLEAWVTRLMLGDSIKDVIDAQQ